MNKFVVLTLWYVLFGVIALVALVWSVVEIIDGDYITTAVVLGFVLMTLGWVGASHTARQIEQIPYLISGGLIGLALVVLGGILLAATFGVAVLRKVQEEADARARAGLSDGGRGRPTAGRRPPPTPRRG